MTRLSSSDIRRISPRLHSHESELRVATGRSMLGIACHGWGVDESICSELARSFSIDVIPVTAGLGIIDSFSQTVADILKHLGFRARVTEQSDISGLASAYEGGTDGIMMADDRRFIGVNLKTGRLCDNAEATGRVFAAALDLMSGGIRGREVLVVGCGMVGEAAARTLLESGAAVVLYDKASESAASVLGRLSFPGHNRTIRMVCDLESALADVSYVVEANPSEDTLPERLLTDHLLVSAPGVPLGVSAKGCSMLRHRLVHDQLELGVAAMGVDLVMNSGRRGRDG